MGCYHCGSANHPNKNVISTPQCQILHHIFYSLLCNMLTFLTDESKQVKQLSKNNINTLVSINNSIPQTNLEVCNNTHHRHGYQHCQPGYAQKFIEISTVISLLQLVILYKKKFT